MAYCGDCDITEIETARAEYLSTDTTSSINGISGAFAYVQTNTNTDTNTAINAEQMAPTTPAPAAAGVV